MPSPYNLKNRMPSISVSCSWIPNTKSKTIEDTVLVHLLNEEEKVDIEEPRDLIEVETTVNFIRPELNSDHPCIRLEIPNTERVYFDSVTVLCDNKMIEVYGDHSIYYKTYHGETLEETEDFFVYEFKIDFVKRIYKTVTLKLLKPADSNTFWIYGIILKLKKVKTEVLASTICFDNVEDMVKDMKLSDSAKNCFNFLKQTNGPQIPKFNPSLLLPQKDEKLTLEELKTHIDYKFQVLTDFLILREKNINDKLDFVLEYIKSKKLN